MKINESLHDAQVAILHVLLFRPEANFSQLQKEGNLTSDHFTFHLKRLLEQGIVEKNADGQYVLTVAGKEYANRFDTDARKIERQPKVAVLLLISRDDGRMLCQQRLKQPYYGFWGRPTGKVQWGETILETAARELMEETGVTAKLELKEIHHKMDYDKNTKKLLEDKIFFSVVGTYISGELKEEFEGGRNAWMSLEEVQAQEKVFDGIERGFKTREQTGISFLEKPHYYTRDEY